MNDVDWKPIESAPKDGSFILLCGGETDEIDYRNEGVPKNRPVVGFWNGEDWPYDYWDGAWRSAYTKPTHWIPIPKTPTP